MGRKKKIPFKLNPEWMFKEPIDFEYNKYTLLDYLKKCEENFDNLKIYPDFVELSLHIANLQSLIKENVLLLTNKTFHSCDDEILLKELYPKIPRKITEEEEIELEKTLRYSNVKLFDAFNLGKSIWTIAYDSVDVVIKKNKDNIVGAGFLVYYLKQDNQIFVWEYQIKKPKKDNYKLFLNKIHEGPHKEETLDSIIETKSVWKEIDLLKKLPVFEIKSDQNLPIEQTILPMAKRKILSQIFQTNTLNNIKTF